MRHSRSSSIAIKYKPFHARFERIRGLTRQRSGSVYEIFD